MVLSLLSYASEVWALDPSLGEAAKNLHRQILKQLLHIRNSIATEIVLHSLADTRCRFIGSKFCVFATEFCSYLVHVLQECASNEVAAIHTMVSTI